MMRAPRHRELYPARTAVPPAARSNLRSIVTAEPAAAPPAAAETPSTPAATHTDTLTWLECGAGFVVLVVWLLLFGGGILVDTEPYRRAISSSGVDALIAESGATAADAPAAAAPRVNAAPAAPIVWAWLVVLSCFVPLNLAWLCVASSTLGAFGNRANLSDDQLAARSLDTSNPYASALLRGFFVYLFMMSGLLLLDDAPFSNAGPGQYIRLAGFLSLFSFVVSYQPRLFSALILSAFQRIQSRGVENTTSPLAQAEANTVHANVAVDGGSVDVEVTKSSEKVLSREG
jgi:hypothetical protein